MAVASPYAVFRAVDLSWPPALSSPFPARAPIAPQEAGSPGQRRRPIRKRQRNRPTLRGGAIQGELF